MDRNSAPKLSYTQSATIFILKASPARDETTLIYAICNPIPIRSQDRLPTADPASGDTAKGRNSVLSDFGRAFLRRLQNALLIQEPDRVIVVVDVADRAEVGEIEDGILGEVGHV